MPVIIPAFVVPNVFHTVAIVSAESDGLHIFKVNPLLAEVLADYIANIAETMVIDKQHETEYALVPELCEVLNDKNLTKYINAPVLCARNEEIAKNYIGLMLNTIDFVYMCGISVYDEYGIHTDNYKKAFNYFGFKENID